MLVCGPSEEVLDTQDYKSIREQQKLSKEMGDKYIF